MTPAVVRGARLVGEELAIEVVSSGHLLSARGLHVNHVLRVVQVSTPRNITLTLDEEILREARVLAAQRGLSVSAFLRGELARLVEQERGYSKARDAALRRLRRGQSLGGRILASRDELHDRDQLR